MIKETSFAFYKLLVILLPVVLIVLVSVVIKSYSGFMTELKKLTNLYVDAWNTVKKTVGMKPTSNVSSGKSTLEPKVKKKGYKGLDIIDMFLAELGKIKKHFGRVKKRHQVSGLHHEVSKVEAHLEKVKSRGDEE